MGEKPNNPIIDGIGTGIDGQLGRGCSFTAPVVGLRGVDPFDLSCRPYQQCNGLR